MLLFYVEFLFVLYLYVLNSQTQELFESIGQFSQASIIAAKGKQYFNEIEGEVNRIKIIMKILFEIPKLLKL